MFEFLINHKKTIMTYTLWLIIPSFIVMYGVGECSMPQQYRWVAKVNGKEITEQQWRSRIEMLRSRGQASLSDEQIRQQALASAIAFELIRQKADEWGVTTTDGEIKAAIQNSPDFQDENGNFIGNEQYTQLLISNGIHPYVFVENQRIDLTHAKVQTVAQQAYSSALTDKERDERLQNTKTTIELLSFVPSSYTDEVTVDEAGLKSYFEENIEDYRIPEQRKITYVKFNPADYQNEVNDLISDATAYGRLLDRFFTQNQTQYEIPEKVRVERLTYSPSAFSNQVTVTEDELKAHFDTNISKYQTGEQVKVRYVAEPLAALAEQQSVTDEAVADYYERNLYRYEHKEQVKARHILLRVDANAAVVTQEQVKSRLLEIRDEITGGLSFEDAAKTYSDDTGSGANGGDLGYFDRERMVPEFSEAAFSLPLGQISEPVKTQFGFHLIKVEDRKEAGTDTLEDVRDEIESTLKKQYAVTAYRQESSNITSLEDTGKPIFETDWIKRGEPVAGIPETDRLYFSSIAFQNNTTQKIKFSGNQITENLYLIETTEKLQSRPQTFEEARAKVEEEVKQQKAEAVAQQAAEADMERIRNQTATLDTIATERGLEITATPLFGRSEQFVQGLGPNPSLIINTAMTMNVGDVDGPFSTTAGSHIIRLLSKEPAHLPELAEVQTQVEQEFITQRTKERARSAANAFSDQVYADQAPLSEEAVKHGHTSETTEFFKQSDPIPGIGTKQEIASAVFGLENIGDISLALESTQGTARPGVEPVVDGYMIVQLDDFKEDYLPELSEVRQDVEEDYKLHLAEDIAIAKANEVVEQIKQKISSSQPLSATQTIALEEFADGTDSRPTGDKIKYLKPTDITGTGQVPGYRSLAMAKTAMALEPGKISGVIINRQKILDDDNQLVDGKLNAAHILQVLGKPVDDGAEDPAQSITSQLAQFFEQSAQRNAVSSWIAEVSATADIEYDLEIINPVEDELDSESI